jgi:glycosyltransferase involved in cell wall biosynthesis
MRIILAHNYYGSSAPSGENVVFEAEAQLLRQRGHTVTELTRHSDEIRCKGAWGVMLGALSTPWNPFSKLTAERLIRQKAPDVFHVHNSFPLLSPSVFYAAKKSGTAMVLTLHNTRVYCASPSKLRDGGPCTECVDSRSVWPALHHRCYRDNLAATIPMAAMIWLHRRLRTWETQIDAFIALTEFQKDLLCGAGLPRERVFLKPNFYADPPDPLPWSDREAKVLFIGRFQKEKGVHILIEAWRLWGAEAPHLELIGDGPERAKIEDSVAGTSLGDKISFRGQIPFREVQASLGKARMLILPSITFEGFPMVIREAFALGVPVASSRLGAMPYLIDEGITGTLFKSGDPIDLLDKVKNAWMKPEKLSEWGAAARREFERKFTADTNYQCLMQIYENAIEHKKKKLFGRGLR